jgi:hypothetical protein
MVGLDSSSAGLSAPAVLLDIGITGHRSMHPVFAANRAAISETLSSLVEFTGITANETVLDLAVCAPPVVRLHSLLAYGTDLMAVLAARKKGWPVIAPLPFGRALNLAINAHPADLADMERLLIGQIPTEPDVAARAMEIQDGALGVSVFELAEQDVEVERLYRAQLAAPQDGAAQQAFVALCSDRAAMAARVMIDHTDILIGIWDGETRGSIGGTRHTIEAALEQGVPVVWIDARNPQGWQVLRASEELAGLAHRSAKTRDEAGLRAVIRAALLPTGEGWQEAQVSEHWRGKSSVMLQAYRRIELLFGQPGERPLRSLTQHYEHPDAIATGSGAAVLAAASALPGGDSALITQIAKGVLRPFAWADGVSTWLSDAYRGGMVMSFFLSAFAIVGGIAYLPVATVDQKWAFALFEFALLAAIIGIFFAGKRLRWHQRWFETRRVAEYFRHAPIQLLLGAARSAGRWPRGSEGNWPEWYVRHALRRIGLPRMQVTPQFLRAALALMRDHHVDPQRGYHSGKVERLRRAQRNLDRLSEGMFIAAVLSVALYLLIELGALLGWLPHDLPHDVAKGFTFVGVLLPTLGGAFAGVHYFGDFERFAAISEVTAEKLGDVGARIAILLSAPDADISYAGVSALAHAIDDIVVDEIENWQAVFGGKHITVPV